MKTTKSGVKRILVIEDELAICELCQRVLTREGFEVDIAVNGKAAQDMIEKQQYHLFLIDIRLPVMNGKELYQWLQEKHPQLISMVIFTSGSVVDGETQSFLENTGRPFLPKPFNVAYLIAIVKESLEVMEN